MSKLFSEKVVNPTIEWYFENYDESFEEKASKDEPKFAEDVWDNLLIEAITSFNKGLDLEPDNRRALINTSDAVNVVGADAFDTIALLVTAQELHKRIAGLDHTNE